MRQDMANIETSVIPVEFQECTPHQLKDSEIKAFLNRRMRSFISNQRDESQVKSIGECTSVKYEGGIGHYTADLMIRDKSINDPSLIINLLKEAGAILVDSVFAEIYNAYNEEILHYPKAYRSHWRVSFFV